VIYQQYLVALPMGDLKVIASTLKVQPGMISRARLVRAIIDQTFQPGAIKQCLDDLQTESKNILLAVFSSGDYGQVYETQQSSDDRLAISLLELLATGLIFGRRNDLGTIEFVIPEDLRDPISAYFSNQLAEKFLPKNKPPMEEENRNLSIIRNIFSFVNELRHNPAKLTDNGKPYKRVLDGIAARWELVRPHLPYREQNVTEQMQFVIDYSCWCGLTHEENGRLRSTPQFESWIKLPTLDKIRNLLLFLQIRETSVSPAISMLPGILRIGVTINYLDSDQLLRCILRCAFPHTNNDNLIEDHRNEMETALRVLEWIGILKQFPYESQIGTCLVLTEPGRHVLSGEKWADENSWSTEFIVQPTFEIIAPHNLDLPTREKLEWFADLIKVDLVLTYRITKETIYRAANGNMTGDNVINFLVKTSQKELPQNVEYSIRSWQDSYGQVYFLDVFLLRTANPEIASHIKAHGELSPYIRGEIAPDALIVERNQYWELMDLLQKQGYMPKSEIIPSIELTSNDPSSSKENHRLENQELKIKQSKPQTSPSSDQILGFGDCIPNHHQWRRTTNDSYGGGVIHFEKAANLQYLSPKQTEELLEMAIQNNQRAVIDFYQGNRSRSFLHRIKPMRIDKTRGTAYVEAHSTPESDMRVFKISNIRAIRIVYENDEAQQM